MATFNTEPKQVPMQVYQPPPPPGTAPSAASTRTVATGAITMFTWMLAWAGVVLIGYGICALCLIKKYHPEMALEQEKGDIVALAFGLVLLVVMVPASLYIRNRVRR